MAGATRSTFDAILKEFYVGGVIAQLNNEVLALELFEKAIVDWNGKRAIIPVHVARNDFNSTAQFVPESGTLPTAGNQSYEQLQITAQYQYGRFQITGPAMASAKSGGKGAFISYTDAEMNKLVADVRNTANRVSMTGGACVGYIYEKKVWNTGAGAQVPGAAGGTFFGQLDFAFRGDYTVLEAARANGMATASNTNLWIPVDLVRMDTYNTVGADAVPSNNNFLITDFDSAAGTVKLAFGTDSAITAGANIGPVIVGGATLPGVKDGTAVAVIIRNEQATSAAGAVGLDMSAFNSANAYTYWIEEPVGVQGNLSLATHFSVTRNAKDSLNLPQVASNGSAPPLRSWVFCGSKTNATSLTGAALAIDRIQHSIDSVKVDEPTLAGGGPGRVGGAHEVDVMLMHPRQRQQYIALLQGTIGMRIMSGQGGGPTRKGDAGFMDVSYGDIPIKVSRAVPNGSIFFVNKTSWNLAQLESGKFADLDGAILSRVSGQDSWEGFYRWYWNLVCKQPNCNVILTGLELA